MDPRLETILSAVRSRFQRHQFAWNLTILWGLAALVLLGMRFVLEAWRVEKGLGVGLVAAVMVGTFSLAWVLTQVRSKDIRWVAGRIEERYPNLKQRLLTAVGMEPTGSIGFLRRNLLDETLHHARAFDWSKTVSSKAMTLAWMSQCITFACCLLAAGWMLSALKKGGPSESNQVQSLARPHLSALWILEMLKWSGEQTSSSLHGFQVSYLKKYG